MKWSAVCVMVILSLTIDLDATRHRDVTSASEGVDLEVQKTSGTFPLPSKEDPGTGSLPGRPSRRPDLTPNSRTTPNSDLYTAAAILHKKCGLEHTHDTETPSKIKTDSSKKSPNIKDSVHKSKDEDDLLSESETKDDSPKEHESKHKLRKTYRIKYHYRKKRQSEDDLKKIPQSTEDSRQPGEPKTTFHPSKTVVDIPGNPDIIILAPEQQDHDGHVAIEISYITTGAAGGDDTTVTSPSSDAGLYPNTAEWGELELSLLALFTSGFIVISMCFLIICAFIRGHSHSALNPNAGNEIEMQQAWA